MKIKQVVVVEGITDTLKLKKIFGKNNIDTIETNGLALSNETLKLIEAVNAKRGIIVFTDPDGPGNRIRDNINMYLNFKCFNAFINKKNINNSKKIGIAEANDEDIINSLSNLIKFNINNFLISWFDFLNNDFHLKENRIKIAKNFNWSENINVKKLFKWINLLNLDSEKIKKILGE
ncbi:ribonuclease M5 [Spiroplasma taiwanense]|uniref:Ribonuclease M5 n=1 Tax=Spiroplasma taiwanense CT-1 TaxID=1276220 RepID=S5M106_9MOLU|nr:ribonuclease M5 [Spiroplasma taiwanense]AGR41677.1 primase-like protein [Spiroplasma taiwanense CT-1]